MGSPSKRTREGFKRFFEYAHDCQLIDPLREIARRHGATLFDVYMDTKTVAAASARIEAWFWLMSETRRSPSEVAAMFDRTRSSVLYAMKQLGEVAARLDVQVALDTAPTLAKMIVTAPDSKRAIKTA